MTTSDVLAARAGDRDAFTRLVQIHAGSVCAVTTAILRDPVAGEEVGQEAFLFAWADLRRLRDPARFGPWLRGIARNRAREAARRRRREVGPAPDTLPSPDASPEEALDAARREAELWRALDALAEEDRELLVTFYREGGSVREVAGLLQLTEPAVRKRLERARTRLRADVEERLGQRIAATAPRAAAFAVAVGAGLAPQAAKAGAVGLGAAAAALIVVVAAGGGVEHVRSTLPPIEIAAAEPAPAPDHLARAFLAAEDARFFAHGAVDLRSLGRAVWNTAGGARDGGSTITQQLAKRMLGEGERSVERKAAELVLAVELEQRLPKAVILRRYLDGVYLGEGTHGVEAAAQRYFGVPADELTLAQAATLAAIPAHPAAYAPTADPEAALERRRWVLSRMVAMGWATPEEAEAAAAAALL